MAAITLVPTAGSGIDPSVNYLTGIVGGISYEDWLRAEQQKKAGGGIVGGIVDTISSGLGPIDEFVNDNIPGGWITVGAAALTAGALSGAGAGAGAASGTTAGAAGAGGTAGGISVGGAFVPTAGSAASFTVPAGLVGAAGGTAAGSGITGGAGGSTGFLVSPGTTGLSGAGSAAGIAGTQAAAGLGVPAGSVLTGGAGAIGAGLSGVGSLSPALPAAGGVGGAGAGLSAQLAPGTILGTGLAGGGEIGVSYMLGTNGLPALNAAGQLIPASSISFGGQAAPASLLGVKDALDAIRIGRRLFAGTPATPAGATQQFRQNTNTVPQGAVDYSGILSLLQTKDPRRNPNSLLG